MPLIAHIVGISAVGILILRVSIVRCIAVLICKVVEIGSLVVVLGSGRAVVSFEVIWSTSMQIVFIFMMILIVIVGVIGVVAILDVIRVVGIDVIRVVGIDVIRVVGIDVVGEAVFSDDSG